MSKSPKSMMKVSRELLCSEMEKKGQIADESRHNGFRCAAYARKQLGIQRGAEYLDNCFEKISEDEQFELDKAQVVKEIAALESQARP
ncbi:uncharacterized protein LOC131333792 isoform X3 [Rhododendron vialii]|uniref:uncharacterized protein LOC131333792 isoform X3 n=1 Tax=Rhododendron vialii TaxID=182163 RepID=UPI00265FD952|nr:uncharacterized protein LOC131333792 isoform X3 [Rhododendron vialii]